MPLITTTISNQFRSLGRRGEYPWETLQGTLRRELGPEDASLFAEPVANPSGGTVDWYSNKAGIPMSALSDEAKKSLRDELVKARDKVNALANKLDSPQRGSDKGLAAALRRAIVVPNEENYVWSVGGKAVLIAWGQVPIDDERPESVIVGEVLERRPRPSEASFAEPRWSTPEVIVARRYPWALLTWLLFAALIGVIYFVLLRACGFAWMSQDSWYYRFFSDGCNVAAAAPYDSRREALEKQIRDAELDLAREQGDCLPAVPDRRANAGNDQAIDERLKQQGATTGALEISLAWNGLEDLDLSVHCPNDERLALGKEGCGGGKHEIDMNFGTHVSTTPVEHIVWHSKPPAGQYQIYVNLYDRSNQPIRPIPFVVQIRRGGRLIQTINGVANEIKTPFVVHTFNEP